MRHVITNFPRRTIPHLGVTTCVRNECDRFVISTSLWERIVYMYDILRIVHG